MFDTKIALVVRDDLQMWQRLNVVAFLATGIAAAAPEIIGASYIDGNGNTYGSMSGQPMMVFQGDLAGLQRAHRKALERELCIIPFVERMFSTGNDDDNRSTFLNENADNLNLVGLGLRGPKNAVDKVVKGLSLHK